jgi:hypothetical protein
MNMRILLCWILTVLLIGCDAHTEVPVVITREMPLGVSFGETPAAVREKRSQIEFVPYAGWMEEFGGDSLFRTVLYQFGTAPAGEEPEDNGRLRVIRLSGRSVAETREIVHRLDEEHGPHRYSGCTPIPGRTGPEEIAILRWNTDGYVLFAEVLMSREGDGEARMLQPMVVTAADVRTGNHLLELTNAQSRCFSRMYTFRQGISSP